MKRRRLVMLLSVPVVVLGLAMVFAGWVLNTESGAHWLLTRVTNSLDGRLFVGKVSGSLGKGLVVEDIRFEEEGMEALVTKLETVVEFSLMPLQLKVGSLQAQGLEIGFAGMDKLLLPVAGAQGSITLNPPYEQQWTGDGKIVDPAATAGFEFSFKGVPSDYDLGLKATVEASGLPALEFVLQGQGDMAGLQLGSLSADSDILQSTATGVVVWADSPSIDLDVDVQRFEPGYWIPIWPDEQFVHGQFALRLEEARANVQRISVEVAGSDVVLEGAGELDLQSELVKAELSWRDFTWPAGADTVELSSDSGQLQLSGTLTNWHFKSGLELDTPDYPGGIFELEGRGGTDSAEIRIINGEVLGGSLAGQASLDWSGDLHWNAQLEVEQLDTSVLAADWPARLDAKFELSQNMGDDSFDIQFENLHGELVGGELKGLSLDGSGGIAISKSAIRFKALQLHEGNSKMLLDGDLDDPAGLEFSVDINRPGWMAEALGGEASGSGHIALQASQPVIDIELKGNDLEWGDVHIGSVVLTPVEGNIDSGVNLKLTANDLRFGSFDLPAATAIIAGDRQGQTVDLNLNLSGHELTASIDGNMTDWEALAETTWSGQLTALVLASSEAALVRLQDSASLTFSASGITLGKACFDFSTAGGLCLESDWKTNGELDLAASLSVLPLNLSRLVYDHQVEFTQTLDGEIHWTHSPGKYPSGSAAISISAGEFGDGQNNYDRVETAEGFFGFKLANGNLTEGEFDIPFPQIGQIDLDYAISEMALDGTGKIDGKIGIDLNDVSVLEQLLPGMEQISGQLDVDLKVSGPVLDPALDGFVLLQNGTVDIAGLGMQLRQVRLQGLVSSADKVLLDGDFMAGDGQGEINFEMGFSDWSKPDLQVTLSGSSLRLLNTAELRMNADTDIRLAWRPDEWTIDGNVVVQQARIAPVTLVVNQVTESEDVQLVAGTLPYGGEEQVSAPLNLTGNLDISLGDKVNIDTELAKAKLSGSVSLSWDGEAMPVATGSIHADGTLSVFGPKLHVRDGQVRFPGVPANNPTLKIRAERDVFGNTQIRTAGVSISGPAGRPVIEAYTNPLTTTDRAWALLITGSDVDYGQGVGAFEVGAYIAPRLYLSYGISLFDDDNVVGARYDLKKGFGVKASSGQRESGIDMSYTIDR